MIAGYLIEKELHKDAAVHEDDGGRIWGAKEWLVDNALDKNIMIIR